MRHRACSDGHGRAASYLRANKDSESRELRQMSRFSGIAGGMNEGAMLAVSEAGLAGCGEAARGETAIRVVFHGRGRGQAYGERPGNEDAAEGLGKIGKGGKSGKGRVGFGCGNRTRDAGRWMLVKEGRSTLFQPGREKCRLFCGKKFLQAEGASRPAGTRLLRELFSNTKDRIGSRASKAPRFCL